MNGSQSSHLENSENNDRFFTPAPPVNVPKTSANKQNLRVSTDVGSPPMHYTAVSMVPTPLLPSGASVFAHTEPVNSPQSRVMSASWVPDPSHFSASPAMTPSVHQNLLTSPPVTHRAPTDLQLRRADSLVLPRSRNNHQSAAEVVRSASVGGFQRQPSTVLHREPKSEFGIDSAIGDVPEEVYLAKSSTNHQTAWSFVRPAGKGSFSEVVLARPAIQFIKPALVDQVTSAVDRELQALDADSKDAPKPPTNNQYEFASLLAAVKITRLNPGKASSQLEYFKRDLNLLINLPYHPCLMRLIGHSIDEEQHNRALYVLPYCAGGDLFDLIAKHRSRLSCGLIRRLFADVCSAVVFLHQNLIVHRDIKLENVLLNINLSNLLSIADPLSYEKPLAILTDLGLARRIDAKDPMLTTRCGSDDYVPPEIMLGQPYDGRETDSWALGVLLYAMLEGRLPFDAPPQSARMSGSRARLRTAHRIARVDWSWYRRKETSEEWLGGVEVVEGALKRRAQRLMAPDMLKKPWVRCARPEIVSDPHITEDLWQLFTQ